jgi:4-hydroxythreonine-4-phosphate dehydrogenase
MEEIEIIAPAVRRLREEGLEVTGPWSPDTVFIAARRGDFDAVVSMYHDQGQIAMKLMGFERGVTLHGGLPVPVATCASGTAFDIVGRNVGNPEGLQEAFDLAAAIASRAHPGAGSASPAAALAA